MHGGDSCSEQGALERPGELQQDASLWSRSTGIGRLSGGKDLGLRSRTAPSFRVLRDFDYLFHDYLPETDTTV
jgi:hypothetical protein